MKRGRSRSSQLIVLFDVLFIFLFASLLEPPPGVRLEFLGNSLVDGVGLYSAEPEWFSTTRGAGNRPEGLVEGFWSTFDCNGHPLCAKTAPPAQFLIYGETIRRSRRSSLSRALMP